MRCFDALVFSSGLSRFSWDLIESLITRWRKYSADIVPGIPWEIRRNYFSSTRSAFAHAFSHAGGTGGFIGILKPVCSARTLAARRQAPE